MSEQRKFSLVKDVCGAMKYLVLFSFVFFPTSLAFAESSYNDLWEVYKDKYLKYYDEKHEDHRRKIWEQNAFMVAKHNLEADLGFHTYRLSVNKFSDMTKCELDVYRKCFLSENNSRKMSSKRYFQCDQNCFASLPNSIDWREKNLVTPVKDQEDCGSCWAFSSTGALEGQNKIKTGALVSLSEQNLVDCSSKQGNNGCNGGRMDFAFDYVIENQGIDTEQIYPYTAREGNCKFVQSGIGANCTKYANIPTRSEKHLAAAVANIGPIAVAIDASSDTFMSYKDGIYYDERCSSRIPYLNHAVLVVGYGTHNGSDYWIVKNSWGASWGKDGYILMARNARNMCGIATFAFYPII